MKSRLAACLFACILCCAGGAEAQTRSHAAPIHPKPTLDGIWAANFVLSIVTSDDAETSDARDAVVRYLKACSSSSSFDREEQSLISILVGRGASARDVVVLFRAAVRAIQIECAPDEPAFAVGPTACLAGILARLTEEYQCQLSLQAATRRAA